MLRRLRFSGPKTSIIRTPTTSLKTSIKTITNLSDTNCLEIQGASLARALYRKPSILFMDEATSHLDLKNESVINQSISGLSITRIIVAHRPSTIASADRIIDMSQLHMQAPA